MKLRRIHVILTEKEYKDIKKMAYQEDTTITEIVKSALRLRTENKK